MSDPGDPFGRNEKTVLRLNPGGRRPTPAPAPQPPPQSQPYQPINSASQPQGPVATRDEWFSPPPQQVQQPQQGGVGSGRALLLKRDVPVAANQNPMLEAAGPLLLLLGRLRTSLMRANFANLMEQVADAIEDFEKTMRAEQIPQDQSDMAKYAVCATADDIVQHIPSEERHVWVQYSMLSRFFGERVGGVRFFEKLDQAKMDPSTNYNVLELMYACLSIGFQGVHRTAAGGAANLQMIQRNLYELLRKTRPKTRDDLSPHWRGQSLPTDAATFTIPFWALSAVAAVLLCGIYFTFLFRLSGATEVQTDQFARLFADTPLTIDRAATPVPAQPAPPPVAARASTQLERIRAKLEKEIAAKQADARENGNSIIISVGAYASFESGQAKVLDSFKPIAAKIAEALEKEPGDIRIVGHTDNVKITSARFPSNYELSMERAKAVAALLKQGIKDDSRFKIEGKGESMPAASNDTAEGRARNRRVEISIPREQSLGRS